MTRGLVAGVETGSKIEWWFLVFSGVEITLYLQGFCGVLGFLVFFGGFSYKEKR